MTLAEQIARMVDPGAWKLDRDGYSVEQSHSDDALSKAEAIIAVIVERCAEVADERKPAIQCMSVGPVVTACEDIATAIRAMKEPTA